MKRSEQIAGTLLLIFSVYVIITAYSLGITHRGKPGAGFMAFWVGILLAISSLSLIINTLRKKYIDKGNIFEKENLKYAGIFLGSALVASLLMKFLGMIICLGLLSGFLATMLTNERKKSTTIAITFSVPAVIYVIFVMLLDVPIPIGLLGF